MNNLNFYKTRKKQLKLTNQEISEISGIPKRTIEDFFSGASENPRIDTVDAINKVLGIKSDADEWTDEEKALGVGRRAIYLSEDEFDWLELRSQVIEVQGESYLNTLIAMIKAGITENSKKKQ